MRARRLRAERAVFRAAVGEAPADAVEVQVTLADVSAVVVGDAPDDGVALDASAVLVAGGQAADAVQIALAIVGGFDGVVAVAWGGVDAVGEQVGDQGVGVHQTAAAAGLESSTSWRARAFMSAARGWAIMGRA